MIMGARVTLEDVARACGVSNGTVSLALNNSPLVSEGTGKLIRETADRMGYIPNETARRLVKRRSGQIGVVIPDIINTFYAAFVSELNRCVQAADYTLTIYISNNDPEKENRLVDRMLGSSIEGIVIVPVNRGNASSAYIKRLSGLHVPFLFAVDRYAGANAVCVMSDYRRGMYDMVKYLTGKGYEDIAFLNGDVSVASLRDRLIGYSDAMAEKGLAGRVITARSIDYDGAREAVGQCIESGTLPRVFVCPNDMMALGAVNTLKSAGVSVPDGCAVTGFDDVIFAEISPVPITTVRQDIGLIAKKSADVILDLINGKKPDKTDFFLSTELKARNSC